MRHSVGQSINWTKDMKSLIGDYVKLLNPLFEGPFFTFFSVLLHSFSKGNEEMRMAEHQTKICYGFELYIVLWDKNKKFVNLQYNTLVCWFAWTNRQRSVQCSKCIFFFIISCRIIWKNRFNLFSYFFLNLQIWK